MKYGLNWVYSLFFSYCNLSFVFINFVFRGEVKGKVVYLCVNLFLENNYRLLFNDFEMYVNLILMIFSEDVNYICLEFEIEKIYVLKRGLSL